MRKLGRSRGIRREKGIINLRCYWHPSILSIGKSIRWTVNKCWDLPPTRRQCKTHNSSRIVSASFPMPRSISRQSKINYCSRIKQNVNFLVIRFGRRRCTRINSRKVSAQVCWRHCSSMKIKSSKRVPKQPDHLIEKTQMYWSRNPRGTCNRIKCQISRVLREP